MNIAGDEFKPEIRVCNIANTQAIIKIFGDIAAWLRHVLRHFGERSEPWAPCLKIGEMGQVYSLHDRIVNLGGESYLKNFFQLCQEDDSEAVTICKKGNVVYRIIAPMVADDVERGLNLPRYVYMVAERIRLAVGKKTTEPQTFVITEPWAAIAVIRHITLRTIYFPRGSSTSQKKRLMVARHHLWNKLGQNASRDREIKWSDKKGPIKYRVNPREVRAFTPKTLGWQTKK